MVKVTIECDGKIVVKQGDLILGGVATKIEGGYGIDAHVIGRVNASHVAELASTLCVNTINTALGDTPNREMEALIELSYLLKKDIMHRIECMCGGE